MSADDKLTENVRVRITSGEKAELDKLASSEKRSASYIARRAIVRELDLLRKRPAKEA